MTTEALMVPRQGVFARMMAGQTGPVMLIVIGIVVFWYGMCLVMNAPFAQMTADPPNSLTLAQLTGIVWNQERPVLPAPHQVLWELYKTVFLVDPTSRRSLIFHGWVTLSSTLVGFVFGALLGILLAVLIVHIRSLEKSLMPWIISSQTIPILAIAPIIVVVFGSLGITGVIPKAIISAYLCFFPVTIGMVKGLTSPDTLQLDMMRTYNASPAQTFWKLRWPSAMPFLFASLKVAIAISLVGAIVGELPTGAQAGLGARMLSGSYYGQMVQIWAALFAAAFLSAAMVVLVGLIERIVLKNMGARP